MIKNQRRTISAEKEDVVTQITSETSIDNTNPTINKNQDIVLKIKQRDFWVEEASSKITNSSITIPLSEYVTRLYLSENYYNKTKINEFIENFGVKISVLQSKSELPQEGDSNYANSSYIFFVKHTHSAGSNNDRDIYDEYVWDSVTETYERIGNTDIDLTPYLTIASFEDWEDNTYDVFVTTTNSSITSLQNNKQDKTDQSLATTDKTVVGAINELNSGKALKSHGHGYITNDGKVGTDPNKPLITTTGGKVTTGDFASNTNDIKMNGSVSVGQLNTFARADHIHPTDTSRASTSVATDSSNGLMSKDDKAKLDAIEDEANKITIDNELKDNSSNPVENQVIKGALDNKVDTNDPRLSNSRPPAAHAHGYINNNGILTIDDTAQTDKNVITDSNGKITVDDKIVYTSQLINNSGYTTPTGHNHDGSYLKAGEGTVASLNIINGTIVNEDIANTTITGGKLAEKTITSTQLADNAVTTDKINNAAVTGAKIGNKTITNDNIADNTISVGKINSTSIDITNGGTINSSKLITSGAVYAGLDGKSDKGHNHDGTYIKTGEGTVSSSNIANGTIVNDDIHNTTITGSKLVNGTITVTQLADNAVEEDKIKADAVTTNKIKNGNVTLAKLNSDVYDNTAGGTENSSKLITSGAVYAGLNNINTDMTAFMRKYYDNSLRVNIYRNYDEENVSEFKQILDCTRGTHALYAKITCDDPDFRLYNRTVFFYINGVQYSRDTDPSGVTGMVSIGNDFPIGVHEIKVFARGAGTVRSVTSSKLINVT